MDDGSGNPDVNVSDQNSEFPSGEGVTTIRPSEAALASALAEAGIDVAEGDDLILIASDSIKSLKQAAGDLSDKLDAAETALADAVSERDKLQADLEAASKAPRARAGTTAKLRKVGPVDNPPAADLLELIREAETVELVFSDGKRELSAIMPRIIEGMAWQVNFIGLSLNVPELLVTSSGVAEIAGYGLFLDGKQAAWAARPDLLRVGPGAKMNLQGDVLFAPAP